MSGAARIERRQVGIKVHRVASATDAHRRAGITADLIADVGQVGRVAEGWVQEPLGLGCLL